MEALEGLALIIAETYKAVVKFGGQTSALPEEVEISRREGAFLCWWCSRFCCSC
jgi:hypothetical protein